MNKQKIIMKNISTDSDVLSKFISNYVSEENIPDIIFDDLRLASEEIFINIVNYAYPPDKTHKVTIEIWHTENCLNLCFIDAGQAFNPLADCRSDITKNDPCEGGMGIHLIESLTDNQAYDRIDGHNVFTVTKHYTIKN